jgi:low temperature requirement protein LtrA
VRRPWYRPMAGRSPDEEHRTATPLELFFDLCFVVAVAQASASLHHDLSLDRVGHGLLSYTFVFFAIWWAWMNFTWFASAYDTDDLAYRLATLVEIAGALIIAAGVPRAFADRNFGLVTLGYVVMRLSLAPQWLRAGREDRERRPTAIRFAIGITVVQIGWVARLFLVPDTWFLAGFLLLVAADLLVPIWAERATPTRWHPMHIAERYGLFTLIVLGESVLAASFAMQSAVDTHGGDAGLVSLSVAGILIVFSMWWLYFDQPAHDLLTSLRVSFLWGYGHYLVFSSAAAVGVGLAVAVDHETGTAELSARAAGYTVAVPVVVFLLSVWALQLRPHQPGPLAAAFPAVAVLVLATPLTPAPVQVTAVLLAGLVAATVIASHASAESP